MPALTIADNIILGGYFVLMLAVGGVYYRRTSSASELFKGGNRAPWWLSGVSFYMSSFSAFGFITYSALAYQFGFVAVTLYWVTVPAVLFSTFLLARRWRRARIDSPIAFLEARYGPWLRQVAAWQGVPIKVVDDALKLVATAAFLSVSVGFDVRLSVIVAGLVLLAYTFLGGLWAVLATDCVQFVVMIVGVLILIPLALHEVGGISSFIAGSPEGFFQPLAAEYDVFYLISAGLVVTLAWSSVNWSLIQRYICVPTEKDARKVGWLVAVLNIVTPPMMFLPAMTARQFLHDIDNTAQVYPQLCAYLLPPGMMGLIIAAMFSATMSTLSSDYNVVANVLTVDVYQRLIRPRASSRELMWFGRFVTAAVGLIALGLALALVDSDGQDLFTSMLKLFGVATAPVALPMILGLITRRVHELGALAGLFLGVAAGLIVFFTMTSPVVVGGTTIQPETMMFWASLVFTMVGMAGGTLLFPTRPANQHRIDLFANRLTQPIGSLPEDRDVADVTDEVRQSASVIGWSTIVIGILLTTTLPFAGTRFAFVLNSITCVLLWVVGGAICWWSRQRPSTAAMESPQSDVVEGTKVGADVI